MIFFYLGSLRSHLFSEKPKPVVYMFQRVPHLVSLFPNRHTETRSKRDVVPDEETKGVRMGGDRFFNTSFSHLKTFIWLFPPRTSSQESCHLSSEVNPFTLYVSVFLFTIDCSLALKRKDSKRKRKLFLSLY